MILWALGDMDGPAYGEVKIGVAKRKSFYSDVLTRMKLYRSRQVIQRCVVYVRGECAALRLKTAVFERLHELGCGIEGPWFRASSIVDGVVRECAALNHVALLTEAQADGVERAEFEKIMDGSI